MPARAWERAGRAVVSVTLAVLGCVASAGVSPAAAIDQECSPIAPQLSPQAPTALAQLGVSGAWQVSRGAGVLVAVVDTGVDSANQHLGADVVLPGVDLVEPGDGRRDPDGRGTALAGQVAARSIAGSALVGVAPQAQILPVRVQASRQAQGPDDPAGPNPDRTAQGIRWAADNRARIILAPQDFESSTPALVEAVDYASSRGALVVSSAGDRGQTQQDDEPVRYPAGLAPALAVTALDDKGAPSGSAIHGVHVELAAPGQAVLNTYRGMADCTFALDSPSSAYAAGYAAGAAALLASTYAQESPAEWQYRLLATGLRPAEAERQATVGWGVLAPRAALDLVDDGSLTGPPNPRFAAPTTAVSPPIERPVPPPDHTPARQAAVGWSVGASVAALLGAALVALLLRVRGQRTTS